ncbi:hypothetical protein [Streptomyces sp. NRRL S-1868]|uniref:hypothetical protein n=1 Tax=Streptomyces sp. NRRL S-1868 TaxID=1463892 RepID=UPI000B26FF8B|nr:hypothetical protein [Streptomyces sp. NRRL S-1868]
MPRIMTRLAVGGVTAVGDDPEPEHDHSPGTPPPSLPHPGVATRYRRSPAPTAHSSQADEALRRAKDADRRASEEAA